MISIAQGLALAGFLKNFANDRIQVFGKGEFAYLDERNENELQKIAEDLFSYQIPGVVFTHANHPFPIFQKEASKRAIPILMTDLSTHDFILRFTQIMSEALAPRTFIHGGLIDVFGVGILIMGPSGIGKSETALELIERGHRLVTDDIVEVICLGETGLYGTTNQTIRYYMELRGLGIINIKDLFGTASIRSRYSIDLAICLEEWKQGKEYERLGMDQKEIDILGVKVPQLLVPVRPGRNLPVLIETAAVNHRSQEMGFHSAQSLNEDIIHEIQRKKKLLTKDEEGKTND